ncbi:MAG: hypothetical protein ABI317_06355 [Gaiellales bacterium]
MSAALARLPLTLDDLLRQLGDACAVCGEPTVSEQEGLVRISQCSSCGSVLEEPRELPRRLLRLVP